MLPGSLHRIAVGTLVSAVGNGAWYTSWALFLTRSVGLSPTQVGIGMTAAGLLGVLASMPIGRLADRHGARETFLVLLVVQGAAALGYLAVHGMVGFLAAAIGTQVASSATGGPRNALVLSLSRPEEKLIALGRLRAISHVGWALGAIAGGVAISVDTRSAYLAVVAINGITYLAYAALVATVSPVNTRRAAGGGGPGARPSRRGLTVLGDRAYVSLAALMGVLALCWAMLSTGLPLWVTLHTHAPRAISATVVLISCVGIAALQVPANRGISSPARAARGAVFAAVALAGSCLLFAATAGRGGWAAVALILGAALLHITGELLFVAASWGLSVPLMPPDAPGEYQGVFAAGEAAALMAAPALMTTLIAGWGQPGWIALAAIFLVPALATVPVTRWALRTRGPVTNRGAGASWGPA